MRTSLRVMRQRLSMQQNDLATQIGVSRQTLSAIESGETVPSTLIALNLARALNCRVEDLFSIGEDAGILEARFVKDGVAPVTSRPSRAASHKVRVALGQVDRQWVARSLDDDAPLALGTPADGIATLPKGGRGSGTVRVRPLRDLEALRRNLLVAGCDPALGLLGRHLEERFRGPRLHWIELASRPALEELAEKRVHIAGLHLDDVKAENRNAGAVRSRFGTQPMILVTLASWELGLVSRAGRAPRSVADLARKGTRVIGREPGAAAQELLESALKAAGLRLDGIDVVAQARGHRAVAQTVAAGLGDAGIATRAAAVSFGLSFEPLAESRFDLVFSGDFATDLRVQATLDCLSSSRFRKDLGAMTGYRTSRTGDTVQGDSA
ncbi:MAG TPA: substrate-binding domain-containing protein [Polyangia bacterium]